MRRRDNSWADMGSALLLAVVATVVLSGCGTFSGSLKADDTLTAGLTAPSGVLPSTAPDGGLVVTSDQVVEQVAMVGDQPALLAASADELALGEQPLTLPADLFDGGSALAQKAQDTADMPEEEYDPWESFNEKMFSFNRGVDRWVFKPAARAYMFVVPEPWQVLISNGFDNINFIPRLVNSMLQGKWDGAGRELARFLINSTAGIGGLFDPAKDFWGIHKSREDFGQTLGVWGNGPGPYLVLPFMEPLTVRDGIGKFVDGLMDPLSYVLPFIWDRLAMKIGDALNERALNYDLFQGFEESVIDMYSAVRHGYLQRRQQLIRE